MGAHLTTRGDHTLNVRVLRFRGAADREEPAMLGLDLVSRGRHDDAVAVLEAALAKSPDDGEILFALGRARFGQGELELAQEALTKSARLEREWDEPYAWLARTLDRRDRRRKACEIAERAIELGSDEPDVRFLAQLAARHRTLSARLETFRRTPDLEEPSLLALAFLELDRIDDAREVVTTALLHEPGDEDLQALAGRCAPPPTEIVAEETAATLAAIEETFRDTVVGEPAPRLHRKRSGWLPRVDARPRTSSVPFALRRDPTVRFLVGKPLGSR